jgi:hypothetical protein
MLRRTTRQSPDRAWVECVDDRRWSVMYGGAMTGIADGSDMQHRYRHGRPAR